MWQDRRQGKAGEQMGKALMPNLKSEESGNIFIVNGLKQNKVLTMSFYIATLTSQEQR